MKKIVILISLIMFVLLGYSQRTVTGPRQSGNRTAPSATVRTPSVSRPQTPSVTRVQPTTTQVQRQTYKQPNTIPSRSQATPNYTVRPGTTQATVQRRSPMPETYKIPQKPSNTGVTQSSDKRVCSWAQTRNTRNTKAATTRTFIRKRAPSSARIPPEAADAPPDTPQADSDAPLHIRPLEIQRDALA